MGILYSLTKDSVCALEITSHIKNYYVARDSSVTLNCEFVFESENLGYTEIAWNIVPSDKQQDDKIIIWYTGGVIYSNLYEKLKNRVHFASPDPQDGWRIIKNPWPEADRYGNLPMQGEKVTWVWYENF